MIYLPPRYRIYERAGMIYLPPRYRIYERAARRLNMIYLPPRYRIYERAARRLNYIHIFASITSHLQRIKFLFPIVGGKRDALRH